MTFKELKNKIKEEQKELASHIRNGKSGRKPSNRNDSNSADHYRLWRNRDDYRHIHIAYCTMFNRTPYEAIERNCNEEPSKRRIENIKKEWEGMLDEALLHCA